MSTAAPTHHHRRGDTRHRIQDVALNLFAEQGYEKTSLREIAEHLDVTKAALYYHFKTKEDILISIVDDLAGPIDDLIAWAEQQPRTAATRRELLSRYADTLWHAAPFFRFVHENQASVRELTIGERFKTKVEAVAALLKEPDMSLVDEVRCTTSLFALHAGIFITKDLHGSDEEKRAAVLTVAQDLVAESHAAGS
jgi:AcrR family transcriptional regulator